MDLNKAHEVTVSVPIPQEHSKEKETEVILTYKLFISTNFKF